MRAGESRVVGFPVLLPATIGVGLCMLAAGCGQEKAPSPAAAVDPTPSPNNAVRPAVPAALEDPGAMVVKVYGKTLTRGQVEEQIERSLASPQLQGAMTPDAVARARPKITKEITDRFISQCVLEHEAEVRKIVVDDKDREEELAAVKASLPGGLPLEQMLAMSGMDAVEFTNRITQELKIRKLVDSQTTNVPPPAAEEVFKFYSNAPASFQTPEYARVRHILVKFDDPQEAFVMPGQEPAKPMDEAAKAEKKKKAEALREQLVKGADFAEIAKANSDCPSKAVGGDLGRLTKGKTVPEFEQAAFSQEVNAIGPVVETKFGYHVIQILSKGDAGLLSFKEVEKEISDYLLNGKRRQAFMDFLDKLKADAKVEYGK